jgi:hypothetical protein
MAHFAKLDKNNKVINVEVINNEVITDSDNNEQEQIGIDFLTELYGGGWYKQTSYNNTFRKNYAAIDFTYDINRDAFIAPQPYPSWILNEDTCQWDSPVPYPTDDLMYSWDEDTTSWVEITGET